MKVIKINFSKLLDLNLKKTTFENRQRCFTILAFVAFFAFGFINVFAQSETQSKLPGVGAGTEARDESHSLLLHEMKSDSVLKSYTINDLLEYKDFYERERIQVEGQRTKLRNKGIQDMEVFLENYPESHVLDKVIVRLAELYYEEDLEKYASAEEEYQQLIEHYESGLLLEKPEEPRKDYTRTLKLYQQIVDEYPESALLDDAYYNIAFLNEDLGFYAEAAKLYEQFADKFPDSRYIPYSLFRVGEYYFNPPVNNLEHAVDVYQKVLAFGDSPRYDEALYRLGWAYYKLNNFSEAISYFTLLADDLARAKKYDPENYITNPSLLEESIEYIGISFLDYAGANGAANYITELGGRDYGIDILRQIGDIFMSVKEEYRSAIDTYRLLLKMYPYSPEAPMARAKIAESYRALEDEQMAYLERDSLFTYYREGSDWWNANSEDEAKARGRELVEHALRENINLLLKRANEYSDMNLYAQAVHDSRKYLSAFPKDSTAALIHWNLALTLDAKLAAADDAFDEYIEISNRYWNSRFQKMAAENAIALAQEMASADTSERPEVMPLKLGEIKEATQTDKDDLRHALNLEPKPFLKGDKKLASALDNYIKIFPHELETTARLAQTGALYYNKNDFTNALKYFKTILRHFPHSDDASYAQYLVMESYFGKLDYKSCEIVAKRIKLTDGNALYIAKAEQRLAESIFLQAEDLASREQHVRAAEEYRRVYEEVPTAEFADLALFNAGLEFDQANEYRRAIETYTTLTDRFNESLHYLNALNNMAFDYGALDDYLNAAITFERLSNEEPDSTKAEVNLYNASVYYVRGKEWERAIRVNRQFVETYPISKDADELFYNIANYHLKLDDIHSANDVYGEYASLFPNSPRVVETFYRRGEYYEWKGELNRARTEYETAIARSDDFRQREMDDNDFFVAEALFRLTELKFRNFVDIRLLLPEAQMDLDKDRKKNALKDVVEGYTRVASYGTLRLYEATHKIGVAYEEFAQTWAEQEITEVDKERRIVARKQINQTAANLYERALDFYKGSIGSLQRLADDYRENVAEIDSSTEARNLKLVSTDTTLTVADHWIQSSKDKISEVVFDIAELNHTSMKHLLAAPLPANMTKLTTLEYRNQLLNKFVKPLATDILLAHQRNIEEADSLKIENTWVDRSRRKILETSQVLAREYAKLSHRSLSHYTVDISDYKLLIAANDFRTTDRIDEMANLIDFARSFANAAVQTYLETLERARQVNISKRALEATEDQLFEFVYQYSSSADSLMKVADNERHFFENRLRQSGSQKVLQNAVFAFEDNYYALLESKQSVLEAGFTAMREYDIRNIWSEKITLALVRSDPEKYAQELGLSIVANTIPSDESWQVTTTYTPGWTATDFQTEGWQPAQSFSNGTQFNGYGSNRLWLALNHLANGNKSPEILSGDSTRVGQNSDTTGASISTLYFRKHFKIGGLPVAGQIQLVADDSYNLFVNGEYVAQVLHTQNDPITSKSHDFSDFLRPGINVVALEVDDIDRSGGGLEAILFLKSLPGWEKHQTELQMKKERHEETLIFERGILPKFN